MMAASMEKYGESRGKVGRRRLSNWVDMVSECINNAASTHDKSNLWSSPCRMFLFLDLNGTILSKILVFPISKRTRDHIRIWI